MAPSNKYVYYKDLVGDWTKAHRELLRLLFTDEGGRESPSKHVDIDARLAELYMILNKPVPNDERVQKKRTRFGDKKLPITEGSHGTYSKMQRGENIAGVWFGLGLDKDNGHLFQLPRDVETEHLFLPLHSFDLNPALQKARDLAEALKIYFHKQVKSNETVSAVSMRLYCTHGSVYQSSVPVTANTEKLEAATQFLRVQEMICNTEEMRTLFRTKCAEAMPLLERVLEPFKTDADDDEEEEGEQRTKKQKTSDPSERGQTVDLFFNKLRPPRGMQDARQTAFKGEAGPHVAELLYAILHRSDGAERMPVVQAPTFEQGAELRWLPEPDADGRLCAFKRPAVNPEADTIVTAKLQSMPDAEAISAAYLDLHTMARRLNDEARALIAYILKTFSMTVCLHTVERQESSAPDSDIPAKETNVYQFDADITLAQELLLYQVYMDAIFTPASDEADEVAQEEAEDSSSSESDPDDGDYDSRSGSEDDSGDDSGDDSDDNSDDDSGAGSDEPSGEGSGEGEGSDSDSDDH